MADYSITAVTRRVTYTGSAGTGPYAFNFPILVQTDLAVYKNAVLLTLTTDYTVSITASTGTGSVTLGSAADSDDQITISGARAIQRTTDFVTAGDLLASSLNTELDSQTIFTQQVSEDAGRAITAPIYDPASVDMTLPAKADRANKLLVFGGTGDVGVAGTDTLTVSTLQAFTNYVTDSFTGNSSTTAFTLSADPAQESNTQVYIDGVYQNKSTYAVAGTTLTFSTAPPSSAGIEVNHGQAASTYVPAANTLTYEQLLQSDIDTDLSSVSGSDDTLASAKAIKTYVDAQVDTVDTLAEVLAIGNTTATDQKIQFRDTGIYLNSSTDGQLDIVADGEVQIAATTIDINGAVQIDATVSIGVDDQGYDFKLFGDTASAYVLWDTSADKLLTAGGATIDIVKDKLLIGGTAVTTTAAELNILDGVTASAAEINLIDGVTATTAELNYADTGAAVGTVVASKVVTTDANKDVATFRNVTATTFVGALTGDASGTAATVTGAAQTAITSLGTLTALQVDNININGNAITSTAGTDLTISPLSGQQIVLDGTIVVDAGVVTGATSITSTAFVGDITGDVTGNADTATVATTVTITDNESTNESNAIIFTAGGDVDGGNIGLESDGTLTYNPSTGKVTATGFIGTLTGNVTGDTSGTAATVTGATQSAITALGTISSLVATSADINGGTVDGAVIGGSSAAAGSFTTLTATGAVSITGPSLVIGDNNASSNGYDSLLTLLGDSSSGFRLGVDSGNSELSLERESSGWADVLTVPRSSGIVTFSTSLISPSIIVGDNNASGSGYDSLLTLRGDSSSGYRLGVDAANANFTLEREYSGWLDVITIPRSTGNVLIGGSVNPASSVGNLALFNGTAPTDGPTNGIALYSQDVSTSAELRVIDEAANITTLSPHNFEHFEPDASDPLPWSYHSSNAFLGLEVNADISGALRELETLTGKKFLHYSDIEKADWSEKKTISSKVKRDAAIEASLKDDVEIPSSEAFETAPRMVEVDGPDEDFYEVVDGSVVQSSRKTKVMQPTSETETRLKDGVWLDAETGKLYRKKSQAEAEAEHSLEDVKSPPAWMRDRNVG